MRPSRIQSEVILLSRQIKLEYVSSISQIRNLRDVIKKCCNTISSLQPQCGIKHRCTNQ